MFDNILDTDIYMRCDIFETDEKYYIEIDLPGFKRENMEIEFSGGYISVIVSKKDVEPKKEINYIKRERTFGLYKREFYVGNVDYSKIIAKYKDGVLIIEVLKGNDFNEKKTIEIK